ncbi:hypothetical protein LDL08_02175 [Nonomuraea glycinis]|jgi:hypothetical protein|uniref:Uncharacterized protein n=1 Tax=Nonomuraea glycinis TaxID=2047744 RepID=A0A918E3B8_9ACTN|nr:hypothetical protein [Nonomuraea glycinis]MCA2174984.1 hypothetical protein [Nonomuraea glycinis]WSG68472.1 hypothetical protein OHA68_03195 [Nonomuraea glycinis]GGP01189.1 hypothetical protein GCM10012278_03770 [Nonomuraea glycinis]
MTIAGSIILIMLGAILTWAVEFDLAGLDINIVGVVLMLGGVAGLLFGLYRISLTRRAVGPIDEPVHRHEVYEEPDTRRTTVYEERRRVDEPPL